MPEVLHYAMAILDLFRRSGSPENPANPISVIFGSGSRTKAGARMSEERALCLAAVWRAVNVLSSAVATLPIHVFRRTADGGRERAPDHPVSRLLRRPNEFLHGTTLRETGQAHALTWGNGYAAIERDNAGRATELWPLRPDRVAVLQAQSGVKLSKWLIVTLPSGERRRIRADDALHVHGLSFDGMVGRSVIGAARESLGLTAALEEFGSRFFGRGANSSVAIRFPEGVTMNQEQIDSLREQWAEIHEGLENAHRTVLLQDGGDLAKLSIPPEDSQFLESRQFQTTEVARWFGVPPSMLYDLEKATFSNTEQQGLSFNIDSLRPWLVRWEAELNEKLLGPAERELFFIEFTMDGLLRADSKTRGEFYTALAQIGAMTPNEIRQRENLPPIEGGDVPQLMPGSAPMNGGPPASEPSQEEADEDRKGHAGGTPRLERRARDNRREAGRGILEPAALTILRREVDQVRKILRQNGTPEGLADSLDRFYGEDGEHRPFISRKMLPSLRAYLTSVADSAELDDEWIEGYAEREAIEWAESSRNQLAQLDDADAIDARLDEWTEKRPGKFAGKTVVAAETAVVRHVLKRSGATRLVWHTVGGSCEMCDELDGQVVGIEGAFVRAGDDVQGEEGTEFKSHGNTFGPPLHSGCQCFVSAE